MYNPIVTLFSNVLKRDDTMKFEDTFLVVRKDIRFSPATGRTERYLTAAPIKKGNAERWLKITASAP